MTSKGYEIGRRLRERMAELQMDQDDLARGINVGQSTISNILTGRTENSRMLPAMANYLAVNLDWLLGATPHKINMLDDDDEIVSHEEYVRRLKSAEKAAASAVSDDRRSNRGPPQESAADVLSALGLVPVKEASLTLGAGGTYLDEGVVSETVRYFPGVWLREFTDAPPEMLVFARVRGDSMKPTLLDGAIVIIDMRRKTINEQDEVWSIAVADIGMVKRIWANPDGSYKIKSDNPNVGPETAHDEEMAVIGRVVASIGKH